MAFFTVGVILWILATRFHSCLSLRSRSASAAKKRASFIADSSDDSATAGDDSFGDVAQRMQYWSSRKPDIPPSNSGTYLVFDPDFGGLNNIRIGWEAAGYAAAASGRTLVLPPERPWYLLDNNGPPVSGGTTSRVEDFINLDQLKNGLSTLTFDEFVKTEREELDRKSFGGAVPSYQGDSHGPDLDTEWKKFAHGNLDLIEGDACTLANYQNQQQRFLYVPASDKDRIFGCSVWWEMGQPKFKDNDGQAMPIPGWGYKLLKDSFVWNPRFWSMAAPVVQNLGLFTYFGLHARFGDFQYKESKQPFDAVAAAVENVDIESRGTGPVFFQTQALRRQRLHARARVRGEQLAQRVSSLVPLGETLYIATDERSPALLEAFTKRGIKAVRWDELLSQGEHGPLAAAFVSVGGDMNLLKKFSGPIEQLICANSKVFIGTSKSTFSGYIQRLRTYNGAPEQIPLYHTSALTAPQRQTLQGELAAWSSSSTPFDADAISGVFPPAAKVAAVEARPTENNNDLPDYLRPQEAQSAADRQAEHDNEMSLMMAMRR